MVDFLRECNTGKLETDPKTFLEIWCQHCNSRKCSLAGYAKSDLLAIRNATWREKYFGDNQADLTIPKFAEINRLDFKDMFEKAVRLEVSAKRGDWSVPEIAITDGRAVTSEQDTTEQVDAAIRQLAQAAGRDAPEFPEDFEDIADESPASEEGSHPDDVDLPDFESESPPPDHSFDEFEADPAPPLTEPAPAHAKAQPVARPSSHNTPDQGDVMIGGSPSPVQRSLPSHDPWAVPPKAKVRVVKAGAKIQFGDSGKGKVLDD